MRWFPVRLVLVLWGAVALAQQPSVDPASQSAPGQIPSASAPVNKPATDEPEDRVRKDNREPPPTPLEEREKEIRRFDPLDRDDDQAAAEKAKEKEAREAREAQQRRDSDETPLPGSVAAGESRNRGPQVVGGDETGAPAPGYAGPAVLSHTYTLNGSLIPDDLKWTSFFRLSSVYDSGVNAYATGPQGSVQNSLGLGFNAAWGISGRHKFHRDSVGIAYNGGRSWYTEGSQYAGLNNRIAVDYTHVVSRRLSFKFTGTGSIFSQSYTLQNEASGPQTPVADMNVGTTPILQIFDDGIKTFSTGITASWQQNSRLSYTAGVSYFDTMYDNPALLGVTGEQAQGNVNYRLTSRTTAGLFYTFSVYSFPHGAGTSDSNTIGGLYSYAFNRATRLQLRAGGGITETLALQTVPLNPIVASLYGFSTEIVDGYYRVLNQDISATFTKDFSPRETVSLTYSKGIAPGNGIFLSTVSEVIAVSAAMKILGRYPVMISMGRQSLSSAVQNTGSYVNEYVHISGSRALNHTVSLSYGADYHYYQIAGIAGLRNEVSLSCGIMWNHTDGRLWPLW
jgi:hypothetical protein